MAGRGRWLGFGESADDEEGCGAIGGDFFRAPAEQAGFEAPFLGDADDDEVESRLGPRIMPAIISPITWGWRKLEKNPSNQPAQGHYQRYLHE